jgi:fibronectin-binding autotransporter adhesin
MKLRQQWLTSVSKFLATTAAVITASSQAETLSFNGNVASGVTTHTINATDWADYVGGSGTFNEANNWGRLYWRGSAGDGQYMHFNLSSLTGLTLVSPVTVTLQNANPTWGGGVNGSYVATANGAWTATGGAGVPGATAISNAVNATGSYGSGQSVSWGIGSSTFQSYVNDQANFNGLAIIGGSGSQLHFSGPTSPYLTAQTGTVTATNGIITADTGASSWNLANYSFVGSNAYSPTLNTLTISGALGAGNSGAGNLTINNGGTVAVNQAGNANFLQALDGATINAGGRLTINAHSNIGAITLAGGELASTGVDGTWGSWGLAGATTVTGGVTSTISAQQVTLSNGNFNVGSDSTLNFTGTTRAGSLVKSGAGTMRFTGYQNYTGGTTINEGTLEVAGQNSGNGWLRGAVTINAGGTLAFTGGDGSGFGWNSPVTSLNVNGGTFAATGGAHVGFGSFMTVGLNNGGTISGTGQWNGDGLLGFSSSGDSTNTFNGSWVLRGDNGRNHTFNVGNGSAAVDLQVNANFGELNGPTTLVKTGEGTMALSGNSSYTGGTVISAGTLSISSLNNIGSGSLTLGGGTLRFTGASGEVNRAVAFSAGSNAIQVDAGSSLTIGVASGNSTAWSGGGSVTKTGAGALIVQNNGDANAGSRFVVGSNYGGNFSMQSGTLTISPTSFMTLGDGGQSDATATYSQTDGTATYTADGGLYIGNWGSGSNNTAHFIISGGNFTQNTGVTYIGRGSGGASNTTGNLSIGGGSASAVFAAPTLNVAAPGNIGNITLTTNGILEASSITDNGGSSNFIFDGGTLRVSSSFTSGTLLSGLDSAQVRNAGAIIDTNGKNATISQAFINAESNVGGITKTGQGSLTLSGNNTYTGATNVTGGTLVVNGTISSSSLTTVASGATLGGSGTVGALTISTGGSINPGNSPGILNVNGAYNQAGTLIAEITGTTPGTGHDQINVTGSVNLSGALTLDVTNAGTGYVLNSMIFLILNDGVDAVTGAFSNYAQGANVGNFGGFDWIITYQADSTTSSFTGGNDVALRAIPEASTALLSGLGALGLLRRRRNA